MVRFLSNPTRRDPWLVVALAALLFLPALGSRDLWNPDEARYAQVSREMLEAGSFVVPRLNGGVYSEKPPLLFWLSGFFGRLRGGVDEVAARLPLAFSAIGAILLVFLLGRRFFGRRAGWIAAASYGSCATVLWQGRFGQIDMLLGFLVLSAVACWLVGSSEERPGLTILFFFFAGLATLAKGPVGLLPPLLAILAFHATKKEWGEIGRLRIGRGLVIWVLVVLAWLVPAALGAGPDYLRTMVFKQNVTRYASSWHHLKPWYYYLTVLPGDFFPWVFLLPAALIAGWKRLTGERHRVFRFALTWVIVTLVFFSLSPGKRSVYILSMYPGLALLVGAGLDAWATDPTRLRRAVGWPLAGLTVLLAGAAAALPRLAAGRPEAAPLGTDLPVLLALALGGLSFALALGAWGGFRGRVQWTVGALGGGMALAALFVFPVLLPRMDRVKSARPLAAAFHAMASPTDPYLIYPRLDPAILYYVGRPAAEAHGEEELRRFSEEPGPRWIMIERDDLAKLAEPLPLEEVFRDQDLLEGYVLLRSPGSGPGAPPAH